MLRPMLLITAIVAAINCAVLCQDNSQSETTTTTSTMATMTTTTTSTTTASTPSAQSSECGKISQYISLPGKGMQPWGPRPWPTEPQPEPSEKAAKKEPEQESELDRDMKIIYAKPPTPPVGFKKTREAVEFILNHLRQDQAFKKEFVAGANESVFVTKILGYKRACDLDSANCSKVLADIEALRKLDNRPNVNMSPYLDECERRQKQFCTRPSKPKVKTTSLGKFVKKVLNKCRKGDKDCPLSKEKKN